MKEAVSRLALIFLKPLAGAGERERQLLAQWEEGSGWNWRFRVCEDTPALCCGFSCRWQDRMRLPLAESGDGKVRLLLDGCLFNREELKGSLPPDERGSDSLGDSELLLRLYLHSGEFSLADANGWFAAVVVDRRLKRAILAADRFGMNQLYYCETERGLFVASEACSVLKLAGLPAELDLDGLADYVAYDGVLNDRTLFRHVYRMPPAALWIFDGQQCVKKQHFDFSALPPSLAEQESLTPEERADRTFACVIPRYVAPLKHLAFSITGGWDTRLIASYLGTAVPPSYTYGMNPRSPDAVLGRKVAQRAGSQHSFIPITDDFFREFPQLAREAMCASDGMSDVVNADIPFVFDRFGPDVRRLLTGKYGTQLRRGGLAPVFRQGLTHVFDSVHPDLRERLKQMAKTSLQESLGRLDCGLGQWHRDLLFTLLEECRRVWGGNLAIERTRVSPCTPYIDNDVVALWFMLPEELRQGFALGKALVRRRRPDLAVVPTDRGDLASPGGSLTRLSAQRYRLLHALNVLANARRVPPRLRVDRLAFAKLGSTQYRRWWRDELAGFIREILLDRVSLDRGLFSRTAIERAVSEHLGRKADRSNELRKMLSLELTHRIFFDSPL